MIICLLWILGISEVYTKNWYQTSIWLRPLVVASAVTSRTWRFLSLRTFFGHSSDYIESVYEELFALKYHGNWDFAESYSFAKVRCIIFTSDESLLFIFWAKINPTYISVYSIFENIFFRFIYLWFSIENLTFNILGIFVISQSRDK